MTYEEKRGPIRGRTVAWSGDANNVLASWMHAAERFDFELRAATPAELRPKKWLMDWVKTSGAAIRISDEPEGAVKSADCVVTDTWVSMGDRDGKTAVASLWAEPPLRYRAGSRSARRSTVDPRVVELAQLVQGTGGHTGGFRDRLGRAVSTVLATTPSGPARSSSARRHRTSGARCAGRSDTRSASSRARRAQLRGLLDLQAASSST